MDKPKPVYVVLYYHKHGTDCWVRSTEEGALLSIKSTMKEYLGDLSEDQRKRIQYLLKDDKISVATALWTEFMGESFEINPRTVDT